MQTLLVYLLVAALVMIVVFAVAWFVFGRGEDLPALQRATTLTRLPRTGIDGNDVRALRFAQTLRGYKQSEVDWALEKLAREIDELRDIVVTLQGRDAMDFSPGAGRGFDLDADAHTDDSAHTDDTGHTDDSAHTDDSGAADSRTDGGDEDAAVCDEKGIGRTR
ncbi:hypothetical protein GCM10027169_14280 [Gordonia jinhuaensis]|uniref:DivIVA domain-containing protein n=1 Tax=Gordonia jinhuaensis TaxID=1517702 RepID=A0A916WRF9_9ACTN|nr:DivIVA domain-containing protein [Gordonia jinhuaensis]GGB23459.1 hypothetical protein GCM10011489_09620 [Gordonia jinhuaensis]